MPNLDRTGPLGLGPLTGRGRGIKLGRNRPKFEKTDILSIVIVGGLTAALVTLAVRGIMKDR